MTEQTKTNYSEPKILSDVLLIQNSINYLKKKKAKNRLNNLIEKTNVREKNEFHDFIFDLIRELNPIRKKFLFIGIASYLLTLGLLSLITSKVIISNFFVWVFMVLTWLISLYYIKQYLSADRFINNYKNGIWNMYLINLLILMDIPFALYLRDFNMENDFRNMEFISPDLIRHYSAKRESEILNKIIDKIPCFSFVNERDRNPIHSALRVCVQDDKWQDYFDFFANKSKLILIDIYEKKISNGVKFELEWINKNKKWSSVFIAMNNIVAKEIKYIYPESSFAKKRIKDYHHNDELAKGLNDMIFWVG